MRGYPAFALDEQAETVLLQEVPSAVGMRGFVNLSTDNTFDRYRTTVDKWMLEGRFRPCTIIPRGHPARSF